MGVNRESRAETARMQVVHVAGSPHEIGAAHGEQLADRIDQCVQLYRGVFGLADAELDRRAAHFESVSRAWSPDLAIEIDAIADASGQRRSDVWAMNARSEILAHVGVETTECTSVLAPKLGLLAQTWDWIADLEPLTVVLDVAHADGHRLATVTEPGMVGKIGLSSTGVAVGLNFLSSPTRLDGVAVHVLLRGLLDARSGSDLDALLDRAGPGRSAHVFLASRDATSGLTTGSSLEFTGDKMFRRDSTDEPLLHTNHFLLTDLITDAIPADNSYARFARSQVLIEQGSAVSVQTVKDHLDDRVNREFPICRKWVASPTLIGFDTGTVCSIAIRLNEGEMDVRRGHDPGGSWQTISVAR
ncbi:MAG: hypothetical protein GXP35_05820 [Actinobacteria bacterium]|nr:hypothetical protein [Actinomycetota bacterium]